MTQVCLHNISMPLNKLGLAVTNLSLPLLVQRPFENKSNLIRPGSCMTLKLCFEAGKCHRYCMKFLFRNEEMTRSGH